MTKGMRSPQVVSSRGLDFAIIRLQILNITIRITPSSSAYIHPRAHSTFSVMDSNVRWHTSDCSEPNVIVKDGAPYCQSCHETSLVLEKRLVEENRARGSDIHLPEATPLGKANLWWPPSVPYRSPQVDASMHTESCNDEDGESAMLSDTNTKKSSRSLIYPAPLDSNHFRLIYLTEAEDVSSPIHFQLEEYAVNDHPEYETVSYVWGGENCDSTLCKPVYVGRFWDVMLATGNCSALLQYLRPRRGCRVVWVDAICINQADNTEKPAQVSRMGDIYSNCERVVAYLGEDLVSRPPGRTHRLRIDLQKPILNDDRSSYENVMRSKYISHISADGAEISRSQLLNRRYLTRIWIVQELLLSEKAILPLGDFDIICDRQEATRLVLGSNGQQLDIPAVKRSLTRLLQATSHCHASDPRDRVYGLLGLFEPQDFSKALISNYTISWRDSWVGTAAYLLLIERNLELLIHAVGNTCPAHLPSWVPDIANTKSWRSALCFDLQSIISNGTNLRGFEDRGIASGKWVTEFAMHSVEAQECYHRHVTASEWWEQSSHRLVHPSVLCIEGLASATVDSSNGALQLKAIRVFDSPCRLTTETEEYGLTSIWVRGTSTAAHFRIMGMKRPVDLDESYQLFIISGEDLAQPRPLMSHPVLLALTTALSEKDISFVTIHDCCIAYDVHFYSMDHLEARMGRTDLITNYLHSLHWVLQILQGNSTTDEMRYHGDDWIFDCIFPSYFAKTRKVLPLLSHLLELGSLSGESPTLAELISAAAESICPDFDPVIRGTHFHLTIKNEKMWRDWTNANPVVPMWIFQSHIGNSLRRLEVNYSDPYTQDKEKWDILDFDEDGLKWSYFWEGRVFPVTLRFSLDFILPLMKRTTIFTAMCYAREFSILLNEDFETLMARNPTPEDYCVFFEGWGQGLLDELGLVWKLEKITIM